MTTGDGDDATPDNARLLNILSPYEGSAWLPGGDDATTTQLARGAYHTIVLVESAGVRTVARICRASQWGLTPQEQLQREQLVLEDLASADAAPLALLLIASDPPILIETYVPGAPFGYRDLDDFAEVLTRCHRATPTRSRDALAAHLPEHALLDDGTRRLDRIVSHVPDSDSARMLLDFANSLGSRQEADWGRSGIVHTDLIHSNIVATANGSRILDWEGARLGPPAWDLAYFLSPVTLRWAPADCEAITDERRGRFVDAYAEAARLDNGELRAGIRQLLPYVVFRALCWCAEAAILPSAGVDAHEQLHSFADPSYVWETLADMRALDSWI